MESCKHLNLDVLGIIFAYYAEEETVEYPVETLLLVCRSWNEAARSYHTIWSRINVCIGHRHTFTSCLAYAKRRLEYSGLSTPLDITIKVRLDIPENQRKHVPSSRKTYGAAYLACQILRTLAGEDGAECHRWRSLNLDTGKASGIPFTLFGKVEFSLKPLTYPMPSLESIALAHLELPGPILPICPSLTSAELVDVQFSSLPIMNALRRIELSFQESDADIDISSLESSHHLEDLRIHSGWNRHLVFPKCLPAVKSLTISGLISEQFLKVQMPNVNTLHLIPVEPFTRTYAMVSGNVILSSIESLKITWEATEWYEWCSLQRDLFKLLLEMPNLGKIDMPPILVAGLLKWICYTLMKSNESRDASLFHGSSVEINGQGVYISGKETVDEIVKISRALSLPPPTSSWQVIWKEVTRTEPYP
jgi:hypothetical protein